MFLRIAPCIVMALLVIEIGVAVNTLISGAAGVFVGMLGGWALGAVAVPFMFKD